MAKPTDLVQGALDLLILRTLALQPMHGWGIAQRTRQVSKEVVQVNQGPSIPRCTASSNRAGFAPNGESRRTTAALNTTRLRPTVRSIYARSKRNGSGSRWPLIWCWRHLKERTHALASQIPAAPALAVSQEQS